MSNALVETGAMEPLSFMVLAPAKISVTTNNHGLFPNPCFFFKEDNRHAKSAVRLDKDV